MASMPPRETLLAQPVPLNTAASAPFLQLEAALGRDIKGKAEALRLALVSMLSRGHLLIEDVPGVGKTTLAHSLALLARSSFNRLQFTSDMLPSDVVGVTIFNTQTREFEFKPGPVFAQF